MKKLIYFIAVIFLLTGCATAGKGRAEKKKNKKPVIHKVDFNNDGAREIVTVEDEIITAPGTTEITISSKDKKELDKLTVRDFSRLEFIDLDNNGYKQLVIYTKDDLGYLNLVIYGLKNDKLNEIFRIGSPVTLDVNFKSCIPRIKAGILKREGDTESPNYEVWVWGGYKFIKDHNE